MPTHTPNNTDASGQHIGRNRRTLQSGPPSPPIRVVIAVLAAAMAIFLPAAALILAGNNAGRGAWDATVYHEPFIRQLATNWPRFDLTNPLTATTPGYHILLATLDRFGPGSTTALRIASALIGAGLLAALAARLARSVRPLDAFLLSLPLAASIYTFQSAAWLLPDNLAWIAVLWIITLCLRDPPGWRRIAIAGVLLAALVFTRQVHLWAAGVIWLAAWLGVRSTDPGLFSRMPARISRTLAGVLITLPAIIIVALFVRHWGGLTPPRFQSDMSGGNPATPAFILVQAAVLTIGFGPWLLPAVLRAARDHAGILLGAMAAGLLLAIIPETTTNPDAGRYSGWWGINQHAPVLLGRTSLLFVIGAPIGAAVLAGPLLAIPHRARWTLLGALIAFSAAQSATFYSWQRYHEPFLIILLAILAAMQPEDLRQTPLARLRLPAMLVYCALLGSISALAVRGEPVAPGTPPPPKHTNPGDPWASPVAPAPVPDPPGTG